MQRHSLLDSDSRTNFMERLATITNRPPQNPALHRAITTGPALSPAARALQKSQAHDAGADFTAALELASLNRACNTLDELLPD